jgi:hypothetical protein
MASFTLPFFGSVDTDSVDEYYDIEINFQGRQVQLDLNFESNKIDVKRLEKVKTFIANLDQYDANNKNAIEQDYQDEDCDTTKTYVEWHLKELDEEDLSALINFDDTSISPEIQLLKKLHLVRLGLYPDSEEKFAVFDYSINKDITDDLVVVFTDENGTLDHMTMES